MAKREDELDELLNEIIWKSKEPIPTHKIKEELGERGITVSRGTIINRLKNNDMIISILNPKTKKNAYQHKHHATIQSDIIKEEGKEFDEKIVEELKNKLKDEVKHVLISIKEIAIITPGISLNRKEQYYPGYRFHVENHTDYIKACEQNAEFNSLCVHFNDFKKKADKHINFRKILKKEIDEIILKNLDAKTYNNLMKKRVSKRAFKNAYYNKLKRKYLDKETHLTIRQIHDFSEWIYPKLFHIEILEDIKEGRPVKKLQHIRNEFSSTIEINKSHYSYFFQYKSKGSKTIKKINCWTAKVSETNKQKFQNDTDDRIKDIFYEIEKSKEIKNNLNHLMFYTEYLKEKNDRMRGMLKNQK